LFVFVCFVISCDDPHNDEGICMLFTSPVLCIHVDNLASGKWYSIQPNNIKR